MDIFAHGFWALILFFKHPLRKWAFLIALLPDIFTFSPHLLVDHAMNSGNQQVYHVLYPLTHSLLIAPLLLAIVYLVTKKVILLVASGAWASHVVLDTFTHTLNYYPTPYFYPFTSPYLFAVDYHTVWFTVVNYALLISIIVYLQWKSN